VPGSTAGTWSAQMGKKASQLHPENSKKASGLVFMAV
jgi:hypothetical protein